ncbi:nitrous oxide reductase accessory protein NosL [uncultured Lutibacter sp.]|uniref:nitrous oxide reductase accessory protein NosL n=1 Tax=uncultured Lutibacter sp. TaxID=437739 RepID=UPI0026392C45|nr:nitrous oxide reductase accessory protein NosL [uncultured Lutibacter sp.]
MKTHLLKSFLGVAILALIVSCKVEPEAIEYGKDQCSFCKMNVVDKTHSAQYVTKKGKQFKFDAIECMINDLSEKTEEEMAIFLVANYGNPGEMIDAKTATFLISKEIKSPMGANLSAFSSKNKAEELQQKHGGENYTWETLKQKLSDK